MTPEEIADLVTKERREQGLPDRVSDPAVLAQIVDMLRSQGRGVDDASAA